MCGYQVAQCVKPRAHRNVAAAEDHHVYAGVHAQLVGLDPVRLDDIDERFERWVCCDPYGNEGWHQNSVHVHVAAASLLYNLPEDRFLMPGCFTPGFSAGGPASLG